MQNFDFFPVKLIPEMKQFDSTYIAMDCGVGREKNNNDIPVGLNGLFDRVLESTVGWYKKVWVFMQCSCMNARGMCASFQPPRVIASRSVLK